MIEPAMSCPQCSADLTHISLGEHHCRQCRLIWFSQTQFDALYPAVDANQPLLIKPTKTLMACPACTTTALVNAERPFVDDVSFQHCQSCGGILIHDFDAPGLKAALERTREHRFERRHQSQDAAEPDRPLDVVPPAGLGPARGTQLPTSLKLMRLNPGEYGANFWQNCGTALRLSTRPSILAYVIFVTVLYFLIAVGFALWLTPFISCLVADMLIFSLLVSNLRHAAHGQQLYFSGQDYEGFADSVVVPIVRISFGFVMFVLIPIFLLSDVSGMQSPTFAPFMESRFGPQALRSGTYVAYLGLYALLWIPLLIGLTQTTGFLSVLNLLPGWRILWHGKVHSIAVVGLMLALILVSPALQGLISALTPAAWGLGIAVFIDLYLRFYAFHLIGLLVHQYWQSECAQ